MASLGRAEIEVAINVKHRLVMETTPDGHPQVWLLYRREPSRPDSIEEQEMNVWLRRCDVFTSRQEAIVHLDNLLGRQVRWDRYADLSGGWFPELWVGRLGDSRWWMVPAPLNPPGRGR